MALIVPLYISQPLCSQRGCVRFFSCPLWSLVSRGHSRGLRFGLGWLSHLVNEQFIHRLEFDLCGF